MAGVEHRDEARRTEDGEHEVVLVPRRIGNFSRRVRARADATLGVRRV